MDHTNDVLFPVLFKRCMRLIDGDIDTTLKQHNIARSQYRALYYVAHRGEPTQTDLLEIMEVQASTLTIIIDALVRKDWLVRVKDTNDKRINRLRLTPDGQQKFKHIPDPARKLDQTIQNSLTSEERQMLKTSLKKIVDGLSSEKESTTKKGRTC